MLGSPESENKKREHKKKKHKQDKRKQFPLVSLVFYMYQYRCMIA